MQRLALVPLRATHTTRKAYGRPPPFPLWRVCLSTIFARRFAMLFCVAVPTSVYRGPPFHALPTVAACNTLPNPSHSALPFTRPCAQQICRQISFMHGYFRIRLGPVSYGSLLCGALCCAVPVEIPRLRCYPFLCYPFRNLATVYLKMVQSKCRAQWPGGCSWDVLRVEFL